MSNTSDNKPKVFRTLRGVLDGHEPDEPNYFAYCASLRVFGENLDFEEIGGALRRAPTHTYRKGEKMGPRSPEFRHDMWSFTAPIAEERPLFEHIDALWAAIRHATRFLLDLKKRADVDVSLGYRSNVDWAGVEVPHTSLQLFTELKIPFALSVIIT